MPLWLWTMPTVTVKYVGNFWKLAGKREEKQEIAEDATIMHLADTLCKKYGSKFKEELLDATTSQLRPSVLIVANGQRLGKQEASKKTLEDGDSILIGHVVGGGAGN